MARCAAEKLHSRRGITLLAVLVIIAVLAVVVTVAIPAVKHYSRKADDFGCATALETARRQITIDHLTEVANESPERIATVVEKAMRSLDTLCPNGGEVYVVPTPDGDEPFALVCGLHGKDKKQNTRLNAQRMLDNVTASLAAGDEAPDAVEVTLHGKPLTVKRVEEPVDIKRGTATTSGYEGTVAFYGVAGSGEVGESTSAKEGSICYFVFADEDHCAVWKAGAGWSGDSYQ